MSTLRHGGCYSPTYSSYMAMKARCLNPKNPNYKKYGGAGITVCDRWVESYENFLSDMGERPIGTILDRVDNSMGYSPHNCRWATKNQQQNNRDACHRIVVRGVSMTLSEAAAAFNLPFNTFRNRIWNGWDIERAISTPIRKYSKSLQDEIRPQM